MREPVGEVAALATRARVDRRQGRSAEARERLTAALETAEKLQGRLGDPNQRASFQASQRALYELYVDFLMELHQKAPADGHDLVALEASERARSRSLLAQLESAGAGRGRGVEPALAARLESAEQRFTAKTRRQLEVLSREHSADEALAVEQELYAALTELENVRAERRRRSPRYASLNRPSVAANMLRSRIASG